MLDALHEFGDTQSAIGFDVDPHQFLGIEVNPRPRPSPTWCLWIGYLQWHFRTRGQQRRRADHQELPDNIECRDAVLAWDRKEIVSTKV